MRELSDTLKLIVGLTVVLFVAGGVWLGWVKVFGPAFVDQQREQFERSRMHTDAVVQDMSDKCSQLALAKDTTERQALTVYIAQLADGEDLSRLQMTAPVRTCVETALSDYVNGPK